MRIGLIAMSGVRVKSAELAALGVTLPGFVRRGKVIASLPSLGLLTVAALTPAEHEVTYIEVADMRSARNKARMIVQDASAAGATQVVPPRQRDEEPPDR